MYLVLIKKLLIDDFSDYGISLEKFYVTNIVKPDGERQYEKFKELGANALSNEELLAIILRTGTSNKPALKVAEEVLDTKDVYQGKLMGLYHKSLKELMEIHWST